MGHVDARDVHPVLHQRFQDAGSVGCRPEGAHDFRALPRARRTSGGHSSVPRWTALATGVHQPGQRRAKRPRAPRRSEVCAPVDLFFSLPELRAQVAAYGREPLMQRVARDGAAFTLEGACFSSGSCGEIFDITFETANCLMQMRVTLRCPSIHGWPPFIRSPVLARSNIVEAAQTTTSSMGS